MSIFVDLVTLIFGGLLFLFLFWKRLKEDYSANLIFNAGLSTIFLILIGLVVFSLVSNLVRPSYFFEPRELWFWGCFIGLIIGLVLASKRLKLKFVETLEAGILGSAAWIFTIYLKNLSLIFILLIILVLLLFYFFEAKYRRFQWYKSGRVGFSGLAVAGIYFLARMVLALSSPGLISMVGKLDLVLSGVSAFLLFFSLYNLSESNP